MKVTIEITEDQMDALEDAATTDPGKQGLDKQTRGHLLDLFTNLAEVIEKLKSI